MNSTFLLVYDDMVYNPPGFEYQLSGRKNLYPSDYESKPLLLPAWSSEIASLIIQENYSYTYYGRYYINNSSGIIDVFARHTTVKVTDAVSGKTLFDKHYITEVPDSFSIINVSRDSNEYEIYDQFNRNIAKKDIINELNTIGYF